ncbi:YceK/YidQ family lipoprotein [Microbulbifer sp. CAU 1566]|uniref:YceK/YidQ family lipoprotein n=1 Tax=Microbulbifer sp. CAU 1566 TaxID=2933269 RepID=UPI0020069B95|nr:YceK/YidQ family lipoprotein [Microbulbifer sp. CAU 1566]
MKYLALLTSLVLLSGCGTVTTLTNSDSEIARNLKRQNTGCVSVPRVYSGVAYNMCKLNSNGSSIYFLPMVGAYLVDSLLSATTDTVMLPYTVYVQSQDGSINL